MFAATHQYVTVHGDVFGGPETWQFGFRITDGGIDNLATASAIAPLIKDWFLGTGYASANDVKMTPWHRLTEVKVARVLTTGLYPPSEAAASVFNVPPVAGTNAGYAAPPSQLALCVSLLTAIPRGFASHGRIFLPWNANCDLNTDGRMLAGNAAQVAKSVSTLIANINAQAVIGNVQVMSKGKSERVDNPAHHRWDYTYPHPGVSSNVVLVECGRVVDTQRRRRASLVENYQASAVV